MFIPFFEIFYPMKSIIFTFALIGVIACRETKETLNLQVQSPEIVVTFDLPDSLYSIIPFDTTSTWFWIFENVDPKTLSNTELTLIEEIIVKAVSTNNEKQQNRINEHNLAHPEKPITENGYELKLVEFKRQYIPVINTEGEKIIWINFFCHDMDVSNWKSDIIMVRDGGNCYFNLKVNLTKKTFFDFQVNGYA